MDIETGKIAIQQIHYPETYFDAKRMKVVFKRRSFVMALWPSILLVSGLSMQLMFLGIYLGIPTIGSMILFGLGMYIGFGLLAGEAEYTVDELGIRQRIMPLSWFKFIPKNIDRQFYWKDIKWYRAGSDMNRSYEEFRYLKIGLHKWPRSLQLTSDKADPVVFEEFLKVFEHFCNVEELPANVHDEPLLARKSSAAIFRIEKRPDFYETLVARILFWFFVFIFVFLIYVIIVTGIMKGSYAFKFLFVIIPGMIYFYYRIFVKAKRNKGA